MKYFEQNFFDFFIQLAGNNNKEWFDANRKNYEKYVKIPFSNFVQDVIKNISIKDKAFEELLTKDCIFRINRDIRFSKDKTPYKTMVSAVVSPRGKKDKSINGIYFELSPEHVRVYAGIYEIEKDDLYEIRMGIKENLKEFKSLYSDNKFIENFGIIRGEKNKILPEEFREIAKLEPLLFNKQWYFFKEFNSEIILKENLIEEIITCFEISIPIQHFFNKFIVTR